MKASTIVALFAAIPVLAFAETPDKFVRYVESNGSQYVDTGIDGRWNTKVEAQVEWLELGDKTLLGSGDWSDTTRCFMIYCNNTDGNIATALGSSPTYYGKAAWRYDNSNWTPWWQINRIYDYAAEFCATNSAGECVRKVAIDGITFTNMTEKAVDSGYSMYIFGSLISRMMVVAKETDCCFGVVAGRRAASTSFGVKASVPKAMLKVRAASSTSTARPRTRPSFKGRPPAGVAVRR